jgi:hypothetical protein
VKLKHQEKRIIEKSIKKHLSFYYYAFCYFFLVPPPGGGLPSHEVGRSGRGRGLWQKDITKSIYPKRVVKGWYHRGGYEYESCKEKGN